MDKAHLSSIKIGDSRFTNVGVTLSNFHIFKIFYLTEPDKELKSVFTKEKNYEEAVKKVEALQLAEVDHTIINLIQKERKYEFI